MRNGWKRKGRRSSFSLLPSLTLLLPLSLLRCKSTVCVQLQEGENLKRKDRKEKQRKKEKRNWRKKEREREGGGRQYQGIVRESHGVSMSVNQIWYRAKEKEPNLKSFEWKHYESKEWQEWQNSEVRERESEIWRGRLKMRWRIEREGERERREREEDQWRGRKIWFVTSYDDR